MFDLEKYRQQELERGIWQSLSRGALNYFSLGSEAFLSIRNRNWQSHQAALGNMAISIELMLKAVIAKACPRKVFSGLPDAVDIFLSCKGDIPKSIRIKAFQNDILEFQYKTIELGNAISTFGILYPDESRQFKPYLSHLARIRNSAVHAGINQVRRFDLFRVAYLLYRIYGFCLENKLLADYPCKLTADELKFLEDFDHERIDRINKCFEAAKTKAKSLSSEVSILKDHHDFDSWVVECPVCKNDVYLVGSTEMDYDTDSSNNERFLTFFPDELLCEECGLELLDYRDFELVGQDWAFDRTDDIEYWTG